MKHNTKEAILLESLKLFAQHGYDGVTVRDIAEKLGIRQSSLYKHYKSKLDIFTSIIEHMNKKFESESMLLHLPDGNFPQTAKEYGNVPLNTIKEIGEELFRYWTEDAYASAFRKMLVLEQYRNAELSKLYQQYLVSGIVHYGFELFSEMIKQGYFKRNDPKLLALNFYGPIFTLMAIYDSSGDKAGLIDLVKAHIEQFGLQYSEGV